MTITLGSSELLVKLESSRQTEDNLLERSANATSPEPAAKREPAALRQLHHRARRTELDAEPFLNSDDSEVPSVRRFDSSNP